jgi:spore coat polysaccharide biosynthesis protein SpsF
MLLRIEFGGAFNFLMLAVVQARINSSRLPGKALIRLGNESILGLTVNRLKRSSKISSLVIATSDQPADDEIENHAIKLGLEVYRGNLEDVGSRLLKAAISRNADAFARISADSPFIDWRIVDHAVSLYQACHPDLVTNIFPRTFPKGQSVEIIKTSTLAGICKIERTPQQMEHVTPFFYDHFKDLEIISFTSGIDSSASVHCIDDKDDFERAEEIVKEMNHQDCSWQDLEEFLKKRKFEVAA